jgi:CheY-like chemotaxis protein
MNRRPPIAAHTTSELNNLLQIIGSTTELMENIWEGRTGAEKYFAMLRDSVQRAADLTSNLVKEAGGVNQPLFLAAPVADFNSPVAAPKAPAARKPRVMIVDDEPVALMLFEELLNDGGYEVITAQTGFECLDHFTRDSECVDVAILDLSLPFMDGDETFRRLRTIAPDVPVLLTTGFIMRERLDAMFDLGLAGFMPKPVAPEELLSQIALVLPRGDSLEGTNGGGIAAAY